MFARDAGPREPLSEGSTSRTPFGIERAGLGYGQPLSHPLAGATLAEVHDYPWPDPAWMDVSHIRHEAASYGGEYAILGGDWSPFWHDLIDLLGMENMYLKMYDQPELVDAVLQHLVDYYAEVSQRTFDAAAEVIDIYFIGNDLGSQRGPLLSEPMFRRFLLPHLKRLVDLGHDYGLKVMCPSGKREKHVARGRARGVRLPRGGREWPIQLVNRARSDWRASVPMKPTRSLFSIFEHQAVISVGGRSHFHRALMTTARHSSMS